jgi:hypothetical protein
MKTCGVCNLKKDFSEFNRRGAGYQSKCRSCQRDWYNNYYQTFPKEKARLTSNTKKQRDKLREIIRTAKDVPCLDCGVKYPYYVMDFDHLEDKIFNVGHMVGRGIPVSMVITEIAKCEVVCSNCHRERTHVRLDTAESA